MELLGTFSILAGIGALIYSIFVLFDNKTSEGVAMMLISILLIILAGGHASHLNDPTKEDVIDHEAKYIEYKYINDTDTITLYDIEWQ